MQQTRLSWTLTALVLASAVLTSLATETSNSTATAISSTSSAVCAAATCRLSTGASCNRTVAGCPVCVEFQAATNEYTCTTVMKTTKMCPGGFSACESTAIETPSPSSSSAGSLAGVKAAIMSDDGERSTSRSDSGELRTASVRTEEPQTTVTTTSSVKGSAFPVWIVIGAGIVVGCILAAVGGTMYARRRQSAQQKQNIYNDTEFDSGHGDSGTKALELIFGGSHDGSRVTTGMDFSDSVLDLNATPSTSKAVYSASDRSTTAAEGAVFLKSDSWRNTTASSRNTTTTTAARMAAMVPPSVVQPPSLQRNSFRGSHHVKTLFIDDLQGPLDASQLTTEVGHSVRESDDAFNVGLPHSEWMSSAFFDDNADGAHSSIDTDLHASKISMLGDDGGNSSGSTDFYSSKISVLGDHDDDDDFLRRAEDESVAKWKQKFYVEL